MFLAADGHVFQNLAVEAFHLLVGFHQFQEAVVGNAIEPRCFQRFHAQKRGGLLEETFYANHNLTFIGEMLGQVASSLKVELAHHTAFNVIHIATNLSFLHQFVAFRHLERDEDAGQRLYAAWCQGAVAAGYLSGDVTFFVHSLFFILIFNPASARQGMLSVVLARCRFASCASFHVFASQGAFACG